MAATCSLTNSMQNGLLLVITAGKDYGGRLALHGELEMTVTWGHNDSGITQCFIDAIIFARMLHISDAADETVEKGCATASSVCHLHSKFERLKFGSDVYSFILGTL